LNTFILIILLTLQNYNFSGLTDKSPLAILFCRKKMYIGSVKD